MVTADATEPLAGSSSGAEKVEDVKDVAASSGTSAAPSPGLVGRLLRCVTCRRRASTGVKADPRAEEYEAMVKRGKQLPEPTKEELSKMAWWSSAMTKSEARVFIIAPRGPDGDIEVYIDMHKLFAYVLSQLHDHVVIKEQRYAIVWCQFSDHRVGPFTASYFKGLLDSKYAKYLDAVHVVHPSWSVRILRLILWPIASDEFWDQFYSHERIEFMDTSMNLKKLGLPNDIYEYDKFLDKQAEQMSQQAAKQMNGRFGGGMMPDPNDPESKKSREQMEHLRKLLETKGYSKTD